MTPEERADLLYDLLAGADAWNPAERGPRSRASTVREIAAAIRAAEAARDDRWQRAVGQPLEEAEALARSLESPA